MENKSYKQLAWTVGIHFFIMYALTFIVVNTLNDAKIWNLRSFYMALIMVVPMVVLMMLFMKNMFTKKRLNLIIYTLSGFLFLIIFFFIRQQTLVGNEQFLKSMIPHHSSAITMCQESNITDSEIKKLCEEIIKAQQEEIDQMNEILKRY